MTQGKKDLFVRAQRAIGASQVRLGEQLGVSRRTAQRWSASMVPSYYLPNLARLVHPHDAALAGEIAVLAGTTLASLGIEEKAPAPPPPPPVEPASKAVVDSIVCAAAEAMNMTPADVRPGLLAAFARTREIGLTVEAVERSLQSRVGPPRETAAPRSAR